MSRALTVWSRKDADKQMPMGEVERIMEQQGCSEPVAKNLLKYAKLGIGPLAQPGARDPDDSNRERDTKPRDQFPPRLDRKAAAALAEQRLRDRQEAEEMAELSRQGQKKKNVGLSRLGPVESRGEEVDPLRPPASRAGGRKDEEEDEDHLGIFDRPQKNRAMGKKPMQIAGISRLGPVTARTEEVDPLQGAEGEGEVKDGVDDHDEFEEEEEVFDQEEDRKRQFTGKKRTQQELHQDEERRRAGKRKKKDRRRGASEESFEDKEKDRSRSPSPAAASSGGAADSGKGSLMSEAQVMRMMGKDKKKDLAKRGSVRAQSRIQKEQQEWESRKANNPEFWKAPQFALCYSAETGKKARGAG